MRHLFITALISAFSLAWSASCCGQEPLVVFNSVNAGSSACSDFLTEPSFSCGEVGVVFGFRVPHPLPIPESPFDTFTSIGFQIDEILDVNGIQTAQVSPGGFPPTIGVGMLSLVSATPGDELTQASFVGLDSVPIGQEFYLGISSSAPPFDSTGSNPSLGFGKFFIDENLQLSALNSTISFGTTGSITVGVPEPSSFSLLALATGVAGLLRGRRRGIAAA